MYMSVGTRPHTLPFRECVHGPNRRRQPNGIMRVPSLATLPNAKLQTIATNYQTITVFIAPRETDASDASDGTAGVRWFGPLREARLCGHGTLAAAARRDLPRYDSKRAREGT